MLLTKESKMRILENFYAIDYTLFGKPVSKIQSCCAETLKEYVTVKGALLSIMVEFNKLVKHSPKPISQKLKTSDIKKFALESAKLARKNSKKLVATEKGKLDIKKELRESLKSKNSKTPLEELVQEKIRTKSFSLALDNLLIARTVKESKDYKRLNSVEGRILEDAYKVLRDSLVEISLFIDEYANISR